MKATLAERLSYLLSDLNIKQLDFAQRINFTQSYVSMVLKGNKISPSDRFYDAICREFNVNPEWLKNGKGDIYTVPGLPYTSSDAELVAKFRLLPESEQRIIEEIIDAFLLRTMTSEKKKKS